LINTEVGEGGACGIVITFIVMYMNDVYTSLQESNYFCFDADCGIEIMRVRSLQQEDTTYIKGSIRELYYFIDAGTS